MVFWGEAHQDARYEPKGTHMNKMGRVVLLYFFRPILCSITSELELVKKAHNKSFPNPLFFSLSFPLKKVQLSKTVKTKKLPSIKKINKCVQN